MMNRETWKRQMRWDNRYLSLARLVATWSKDPSTKVGAVLVRANNSVASTGYNGFPPGCDDSPLLYADRAFKYSLVVHAEINALSFCGNGTPKGSTVYTSFPVCPSCMEALGKAGVVRVVQPPLPTAGKDLAWIKQWLEWIREAEEMADIYGIEVETSDVV